MTISFRVTQHERDLITEIAHRAVTYAAENRIPIATEGRTPAHVEIEMDVTAVHANGCALRLADLLAADDFNFAHDIFGIRRHLDRTTGVLGGHFVPRFAVKQGA